MKKITCFILLLIAFAPDKIFASHAAGAELRYEYLGGDNYRFHFTLYRDCHGIPANSSYRIIGTSSCGFATVVDVNLVTMIDVSQACQGAITECTDTASQLMGVQEWSYEGDVIIADTCSDWTFTLESPICNRNSAITNIVAPSNECLYIKTTLNNAAADSNSSPVFSALPLFHLCDQVQFIHLYANDPDGDSLAFEMYTPHSTVTVDLVYINGLSATQPVTYATSADSTQFDPATGDIRFKADGAQITVIGIRSKEFRNGILIGTEERDIEIFFENCSYNAPTATGVNGSPFFTAHVCVDSMLTFEIHSVDLDGDSVRVSWQNDIPGSNIYVNGNGDATFTWQPPDTSFIREEPYSFFLYVTDSTCPYVYFNSYEYFIYVDSCFAITGINDLENSAFPFSAFFSSSAEKIFFNYPLQNQFPVTVTLYDMTGRKMKSAHIERSNLSMGEIPSAGIAAGVYLLNLEMTGGRSASAKVVVE